MARRTVLSILAIGALATITSSPARAQMGMSGGGRSLGGYGGATITSYYGGGGGYAPAMGNGKAFVPSQGGTGGSPGPMLSPGRIAETPIGGVMMGGPTAIGGISAPGSMGGRSGARGGMGMGISSRSRMPAPYGSVGGMGGNMGMSSSSGGMRRGTPGPGFGYPFRQPAAPGGPSSMSMP